MKIASFVVIHIKRKNVAGIEWRTLRFHMSLSSIVAAIGRAVGPGPFGPKMLREFGTKWHSAVPGAEIARST